MPPALPRPMRHQPAGAALALLLAAAAAVAQEAPDVPDVRDVPDAPPAAMPATRQGTGWDVAGFAHRRMVLQAQAGRGGAPTWRWSLERDELPRAPASGPPARDAVARDGVAIGVWMVPSRRLQLGWQSPVLAPLPAAAALPAGLAAPVNLAPQPPGMVLRSRDPLADLRMGALMKMSLGGGTTVSLRPRKGGLRLTLQSQW